MKIEFIIHGCNQTIIATIILPELVLNHGVKCIIPHLLPPSHAICSKLNDSWINTASNHDSPTTYQSSFPCSSNINHWVILFFFFFFFSFNFPHTWTSLRSSFFHWGLKISSSCKFDLFTRRLILLVPIPGYSPKVCKLEVLCILLILICVLTRKLILVVPTSGYSTKQEQRSRAQTTNNFTFKGISQ